VACQRWPTEADRAGTRQRARACRARHAASAARAADWPRPLAARKAAWLRTARRHALWGPPVVRMPTPPFSGGVHMARGADPDGRECW